MAKPTTPAKAHTSTSAPPSPPEEERYHVIGYEIVNLQAAEDIEIVGKSALTSALDSMTHGAYGDDNAYGTLQGLNLLSDFDTNKRKKKSLEERMDNLEQRIAELEQSRDDQNLEILELRSASEGYRKIRNRFLDIYRRDVAQDADSEAYQNIAAGNEAAHHGDAVTDAALYTSGERRDRGIMIEIYGVDFEHITSLFKAGNFDAIKVLNAGATWRANQFKTAIPVDVEAAFTTFVKELGRSGSACKADLTNGTTRLSKAYYAFWAAHKAHKGSQN